MNKKCCATSWKQTFLSGLMVAMCASPAVKGQVDPEDTEAFQALLDQFGALDDVWPGLDYETPEAVLDRQGWGDLWTPDTAYFWHPLSAFVARIYVVDVPTLDGFDFTLLFDPENPPDVDSIDFGDVMASIATVTFDVNFLPMPLGYAEADPARHTTVIQFQLDDEFWVVGRAVQYDMAFDYEEEGFSFSFTGGWFVPEFYTTTAAGADAHAHVIADPHAQCDLSLVGGVYQGSTETELLFSFNSGSGWQIVAMTYGGTPTGVEVSSLTMSSLASITAEEADSLSAKRASGNLPGMLMQPVPKFRRECVIQAVLIANGTVPGFPDSPNGDSLASDGGCAGAFNDGLRAADHNHASAMSACWAAFDVGTGAALGAGVACCGVAFAICGPAGAGCCAVAFEVCGITGMALAGDALDECKAAANAARRSDRSLGRAALQDCCLNHPDTDGCGWYW